MEKKIRTLGTLFAKSFYVELDEVGRPSGSTGLRLAVRHPSAVSIVPVLPAGETLLVAQHRYPADRETLEFPAGKLNPGEDPEAAAFRETAEETGHRPGRVFGRDHPRVRGVRPYARGAAGRGRGDLEGGKGQFRRGQSDGVVGAFDRRDHDAVAGGVRMESEEVLATKGHERARKVIV